MQTVDMTKAEYRNYAMMRERGLSRMPSTHLLCGFSPAEISHLLTLLEDAKREGCYYGNRKQYWQRHERIMRHLSHNAAISQLRNESTGNDEDERSHKT
jgi:hypothetical protein